MKVAAIPKNAKTGEPIPRTHVGCHDIQRMFKLSWCQVDHLLKKFGVPYLRCTQKLRWVDREQFLDAYEAKNKPDPATVGLVKLDDAAASIGIEPRSASRLCRKLKIERVRANTAGAPSYIAVADVERIRASTRAAKTKDIPQPAINPPKEVTPPKPGPFDAAIKAHQEAMLAITPRYHSEEAEKAFRRRAVPLTPADELARWRAEHRAAMKRRHDPIVCTVLPDPDRKKQRRCKPFSQRPQAGWLSQSV
jgi:hypothetical protein